MREMRIKGSNIIMAVLSISFCLLFISPAVQGQIINVNGTAENANVTCANNIVFALGLSDTELLTIVLVSGAIILAIVIIITYFVMKSKAKQSKQP
jgi:hypothetical protein